MKLLGKITLERYPTIREEVFKRLREKIISGEAAPGIKLSEAHLAEEIGSSRTPIREALHNLEREKLIECVPRVGYIVREIKQEEIEEIIQIRIALETLATKWAAKKIDEADLRRLERNTIQTDRFIQKRNTRGIVERDTEFHEIICKASKSQRLEDISQTLRDHMLRFRKLGLGIVEIAQTSNEGHKRIVAAMRRRDMHGIDSAVRYHLNSTREALIKVIQ